MLNNKTIEVYDNGGESVDRYTIIIGEDAFGMSEDPSSPQGFNQYIGVAKHLKRRGLGQKLTEIPENISNAVYDRMGTKQRLKKEKDHAFRKDVYLLGEDEDGIKIWLEAPSWDCDWYWGFGYIETYQRNWKPSKARDIDSHSHIDSQVIGKEKDDGGGYCHNPYTSKHLKKTTFSEAEGWELGELFRRFYLLKDTAAFFHSGSAGVTSDVKTPEVKDEAVEARINKEILPATFARIMQILSPEPDRELTAAQIVAEQMKGK